MRAEEVGQALRKLATTAKAKVSAWFFKSGPGQYAEGDKILFKDGDLVSPAGKTNIYLVSNGQLRGITSPTVFEGLGLQWKNVIKTSDYVISLHAMGDPIYLSY